MSLGRDEVQRLQTRALRDWLRWLGNASPGARLVERPGVTAAVVPAVPSRSIVNGVAFESAGELEAALDELEDAYREAGVTAWMAWVPESETKAAELLRRRGHAFDGEPLAMAMELADLRGPDPGDLDWDDRATPEEMGELNDAAYGETAGDGIAPAFGGAPPELGMRRYRARVDGELACVLATMDHGDDTGVYFVATHPGHRGGRLASRLLAVALAEARERGQRTTTLQASAMGAGVYRRLGYGPHYRLLMYERRE